MQSIACTISKPRQTTGRNHGDRPEHDLLLFSDFDRKGILDLFRHLRTAKHDLIGPFALVFLMIPL